MEFLHQKDECSLKVSDQVNIFLPPEAFTNEATNFWFGVLFGGALAAAFIAALANQ